MNWQSARKLFAAGALAVALVATLHAQVKTTTTETRGQTTATQVTVERGEVVYVQGNDLIVRMENGELRHFTNIPPDRTVTVDGKELTVRDLQPGMKLQRTITTTATPKTITTVRTVTGTVWHVSPPRSVILTLEDGSNQKFTIPKGQKFMIEGQETDAWGLKKGMKVSASAIAEVPEVEMGQEVTRTGTMPPPPDAPLLVEAGAPKAAPAVAEAAPTTLPKTGSLLPLIGLLGALFTALPLGLKAIRSR